MGARAFVDTNVLVYLYDHSEVAKRQQARDLFLDDAIDIVISTQVLSEFFVTVTRKISTPMSLKAARTAVEALAELEVVPATRNLVLDAVAASEEHQLRYWDALIVEAASRAGTEMLFSEDMSHGSTIRGVRIVNPFVSNPAT